MRTEKEKMLNGELYIAADPELVKLRERARLLFRRLNDSRPGDLRLRQAVLKKLIPGHGDEFWIEPPFYCDYGENIIVGNKVFINFNCTILDVAKVAIGDHVLIGPSVQIYTALHPVDWLERAAGPEYAKPVTIGSYVWIGGGVIICPGVTIGHRCIIGAGSVVTRDIPDDVFAAGNPCRVIRQLNNPDVIDQADC